MITLEDKIKTFSKYVYEKERRSSEMKLDVHRKQNEERIQKEMEKIKAQCELQKERQKNTLEMQRNKKLSELKRELRKRCYQEKKQIRKELMDKIAQALYTYTETGDYEEWMKKTLQDIRSEFDEISTMALTKKDQQRFGTMVDDLFGQGFAVKELPEESIGGVQAVNGSKTEMIDETLQRKLEQSEEKIGILLQEVLDKVGEEDE
ncbi:MAG TPA: hypothetical protein DHN33_10600 [Eubacteriaceae bacterium]|nr:hypothetical protein [Eubacteriaceae bacterium]